MRGESTPVQTFATLVGAAFLLLAIFGFIPGVTTHYDDMRFAGSHSHAQLFGVFRVSVFLNLVHLLFGAGLPLSRTPNGAHTFLIAGGAVLLGLWLLGVEHGGGSIPVNTADNLLHAALGAVLTALGLASRASARYR